MRVVSLLTDFGLRDVYVAEMKAVILQVCPEARIVDVSHMVEKFNVRMGAFLLACAVPYFPDGSVHVAVVDPGVGTERRAIIVEARRSLFVGPDNGVLMLAAEKEGIEHVYEIRNEAYMRPKVSHTFHGRDIFAPAAAHLARGVAPKEFGPEITDYVVPEYAQSKLEGERIEGEILHVDGFGNLVTNVSAEELEKVGIHKGCVVKVVIGKKEALLKFCSAYGEAARDEALALVGSHGFLEFSVNLGNAAERFKAQAGTRIAVSKG